MPLTSIGLSAALLTSTEAEDAVVIVVVLCVLVGVVKGFNEALALVDRLTGRRETKYVSREEFNALREQHESVRTEIGTQVAALRHEISQGFGRTHERMDKLVLSVIGGGVGGEGHRHDS